MPAVSRRFALTIVVPPHSAQMMSPLKSPLFLSPQSQSTLSYFQYQISETLPAKENHLNSHFLKKIEASLNSKAQRQTCKIDLNFLVPDWRKDYTRAESKDLGSGEKVIQKILQDPEFAYYRLVEIMIDQYMTVSAQMHPSDAHSEAAFFQIYNGIEFEVKSLLEHYSMAGGNFHHQAAELENALIAFSMWRPLSHI